MADAVLLDLGLSSDQLADPNRGFSFTKSSAELDLRFDPESGQSAAQWLAWHKEDEIANAIYQYGEERYSRRIAREIVARRRREDGVKTVEDLVDVCRRCVPRSKNHDIHPATRTFQHFESWSTMNLVRWNEHFSQHRTGSRKTEDWRSSASTLWKTGLSRTRFATIPGGTS